MNKEGDQNLIALLKEALKFYANKKNYLFYKDKDAPVVIDEGSQARFALQKVEEFSDLINNINNDYDKYITDAIKSEESPENVLKIIEDLKNVGNGD